MAKDFTVTINHPEHRLEWLEVFGTTQVHVKSFVPEFAELIGNDEPQPVYYIDLGCLSRNQYQRLIRHLATKLNMSLDRVKRYLEEQDVPVPADECSLTIHNPHHWLI